MKNFYLKKSFALLLFLILVGFGRGAQAETLAMKQGEILLYSISSGQDLSAYFGGKKVPVFEYDGRNYALIAADVSKKLGNYYLRIKEGGKETEKKLIAVKRGNYKQVVRGVPYKFNTLPKDQQESVTKDKAPLLALLSKTSEGNAPKFWQSIFRNPLDNIEVTSPFGYKRIYTNHATIHQGADLKAPVGTPVYAISDGEVLWGEGKSLYLEGPTVVIDHGDGIVSKYLHLSKVLAEAGAMVQAGEIIGYSGAQGADVTGPHLHLGIKVGNASVNPLQFIKEFQKLKQIQESMLR